MNAVLGLTEFVCDLSYMGFEDRITDECSAGTDRVCVCLSRNRDARALKAELPMNAVLGLTVSVLL